MMQEAQNDRKEGFIGIDFYNDGFWFMNTYIDEREMPILRMETPKGVYGFNENTSETFINFVKHIIVEFNKPKGSRSIDKSILEPQEIYEDFYLGEFCRVIYSYIKYEIINNDTSSILSCIVENNFEIDRFNDMINKEKNEIMKSTYGNIELINLLERSLQISDGVLHDNIIRTIIMCNDPLSIRNANVKKLNNLKEKVLLSIDELKKTLSNTNTYTRLKNINNILTNKEINLIGVKSSIVSLVLSSALTLGIFTAIPSFSRELSKSEVEENNITVEVVNEKEYKIINAVLYILLGVSVSSVPLMPLYDIKNLRLYKKEYNKWSSELWESLEYQDLTLKANERILEVNEENLRIAMNICDELITLASTDEFTKEELDIIEEYKKFRNIQNDLKNRNETDESREFILKYKKK